MRIFIQSRNDDGANTGPNAPAHLLLRNILLLLLSSSECRYCLRVSRTVSLMVLTIWMQMSGENRPKGNRKCVRVCTQAHRIVRWSAIRRFMCGSTISFAFEKLKHNIVIIIIIIIIIIVFAVEPAGLPESYERFFG